ncbi:hypothetical protein BCR36DRAFT_373537 [Piromyces finnis]|uniref:Uncharacterized protein n=1 Tax=Piromyces finnis TaxID=1754191 RepID=A0A1Y1UZF1_9FUNG|nr:hypothetical protein BCR36DRAFT_373537 [Piromyces finnis]|eukprot:ORX44056.1 hypothetical protein BCR36DRAFT_373537 [Piromyces finnis]
MARVKPDYSQGSREEHNQGFRKVFKDHPPRYVGKDQGLEYLRDLKAYLQTYTSNVKESQIRDAVLERGGKEVKALYKNVFLKRLDNQSIKWNDINCSKSVIKPCLEKLTQLPTYDPCEDFDEQNAKNKEIYEELVNILLSELAKEEGSKNLREDINLFMATEKEKPSKKPTRKESHVPRTTSYNSNNKILHQPYSHRNKKGKKPYRQSHNIDENILDENITEKDKFSTEEIKARNTSSTRNFEEECIIIRHSSWTMPLMQNMV